MVASALSWFRLIITTQYRENHKRKSEDMFKRISVIAMVSALGLATVACSPNEQRTAGYGVGGAALGALAGGAIKGNGKGALRGAAIGAAAGTLVGVATKRNGVQYCNYRDAYGQMYQAPCNQYQ
ncbi:unnamed protein product [Bartonella apis]|uniref:17 kDa surface antigen n=2 Tax=Bartonella TaxID=773 RepID=A0A1R0FB18_9HYPH|nr:Glycine zipper 2TM domain-containing protein [Bartonella apis]